MPRLASSAAALLLSLLLSACASLQPHCSAGEQAVITDTLYFGDDIPGGGMVDDAQWRMFVDEIITPRFPQGLTYWKAQGQWRNRSGTIARESSHVLQIAHENTAEHEQAMQEIMAAYRDQFHQEAVLRLRDRACMSL